MRKKPMLAYPVSDKPINYDNKVFIQPKLDGVRCVIQYERRVQPREDVVVAYSRTGKEWKNIDHILADLVPFFQKHPNIILDGELYNHDLKDDFEKIISLVRKTKPTDEDRSKSAKNVQFHCYDVMLEREEIDFDTRNNWLKNCLTTSYCIKHVTTDRCHTEIAAKVFHQDNLELGYEGSIVRLNYRYENKRSHNLRKFKDFHDDEAMILDWVEGKGKRVGTIGKFMAQDSEGNIFGMPVMDNFKYLQDNFEEMKTWVGKLATFTYFERTNANSYRHPLFKCIRDYE